MKYTVISFDLSSVCIGVIGAIIDSTDNEALLVKSCPIIPKKFDPTILGYMKSKKKLPNKSNTEFFNTYYKKDEKTISKQEKKRRDVEVRTNKDLYVLRYIGEQINKIFSVLKPSIVIVEKNEIFNGVLTSILLAKIMGDLTGICASNGIPLYEYKVRIVRKNLNIHKITHELVDNLTEEEILKIPDITKRALRKYMESKYGHLGLKCSTDDESDACVVFDYWHGLLKRGEFKFQKAL